MECTQADAPVLVGAPGHADGEPQPTAGAATVSAWMSNSLPRGPPDTVRVPVAAIGADGAGAGI